MEGGFVIYADEHRHVAYLEIPKVGSTSLKRALFKSEEVRRKLDAARQESFFNKTGIVQSSSAAGIISSQIRLFLTTPYPVLDIFDPSFLDNMRVIDYVNGFRLSGRDQENKFWRRKITLAYLDRYFIFTFARNPFSRLASFFYNKFVFKKGSYFVKGYAKKESLLSPIENVSSFRELAYNISIMPDHGLDVHCLPQSLFVKRATDLGIKIDFIGKLENIQKDFKPLQKKFDLLMLEHKNLGYYKYKKGESIKKDWRDFYTPEIARLVYERYREDFEMFGYEEEYPKLLNYLETKETRLS